MNNDKIIREILLKIKGGDFVGLSTIEVANDLADKHGVHSFDILDEFTIIERNGYAKFGSLVGAGDQMINGITERGNEYLRRK
ncbi:hypothetical protein JOC34_000426 [Virgibacillus halotolerans]|uniref:hypothetical protein n=1 Tax=Virgibacillus halotolerans TaxID=1071053 RepID=UPI0019600BB7|nr:hypothetical protein [Virgibacillus halotolerans]MBM7598069.1 hypothetical protein [Virgibacillus halotolerans]